MNKPLLGTMIGGILGLFDGLSAWAYPDARPMFLAIVIGSVVKGILTGLAAGVVARRQRSTLLGIGVGAVVGFGLSTLAATGQPDHFWAIVLPGMLVGVIAGYATQRYGAAPTDGSLKTPASIVAVLLSVLPAAASAQAPAPTNDLSSLTFFLGRWQGTADGQPGKGTVEREYTAMLRSRVVQVRNRSVYPPQASNPKGEEHEDIGIYSFDNSVKRVKFRQFHVEGFVVHYTQEPDSKPGTYVFVSEAMENIPKGYRSRETHTVLGPDELEEVFELAEPGKDFEVYSRTRLKRAK